jgi:hypothetical protein
MVRKDAFNPRLRTDKLQVDLSTWRLLDQPGGSRAILMSRPSEVSILSSCQGRFLERPCRLFGAIGAGNHVGDHSNKCRMIVGAACAHQVNSQIIGELSRFDI